MDNEPSTIANIEPEPAMIVGVEISLHHESMALLESMSPSRDVGAVVLIDKNKDEVPSNTHDIIFIGAGMMDYCPFPSLHYMIKKIQEEDMFAPIGSLVEPLVSGREFWHKTTTLPISSIQKRATTKGQKNTLFHHRHAHRGK